MSEYQYYEFVAVDRPLNSEELDIASSMSTRAEVSSRRWVNEYNFGDFHGSVDELLTMYDAHFYIANWGTMIFKLAFPEDAVDYEELQLFEVDEYLTIDKYDGRVVVTWLLQEEYFDWVEGAGMLDRLLPIREEILRGDLRAMILGYLNGATVYENDIEGEINVFAGLSSLSEAQKELIDVFKIDPDVVAAASVLSKPTAESDSAESRIASLNADSMRVMLTDVVNGKSAKVIRQLTKRSKCVSFELVSFGDFMAEVESQKEIREKREAEEERRRKKEEEKKRIAKLKKDYKDRQALWANTEKFGKEKSGYAYDNCASIIKDIFEAHQYAKKMDEFYERFQIFKEKYPKKPALYRRLDEFV